MLVVHWVLAIVLLMVSMVHLLLLHCICGTNSGVDIMGAVNLGLSVISITGVIAKDAMYCDIYLVFLGNWCINGILLLSHSINSCYVNSVAMVVMIVPEWYFLGVFVVIKMVDCCMFGYDLVLMLLILLV